MHVVGWTYTDGRDCVRFSEQHSSDGTSIIVVEWPRRRASAYHFPDTSSRAEFQRQVEITLGNRGFWVAAVIRSGAEPLVPFRARQLDEWN